MNNNKPLLTIFLVTYNHENTIRDTFEGIIKQKTQYPFIVKILEDCSTDNTLQICKEYVEKYPDLFVLINQKENTRGDHIRLAMLNEIQTPYWCIIEGDDYYINPSWVEKGVGFLENHTDYNAFTGNVIYKSKKTSITATGYNKLSYETIGHDLSFDNYLYIQTSARMYRNVFDFSKLQDWPFTDDIYIYYLYLDKGKVWFEHDVMSVYRANGKGTYSSMSVVQQSYDELKALLIGNAMLGNRHADFFYSAMNNILERIIYITCQEAHSYKRLAAISIPVPWQNRKLAIGVCYREWE